MLAVIILSSMTAFAADSYITIDGFTFDINNSEAVIHDYEGNSENVVIPQKLLKANVAAIDNYAFFENTGIKSVSFENATSLKTIGENAFNGCTGLETLNIPSNVTTLSFGAFQKCSALRQVKIGGGVNSIPEQCFYNCSSLVDIEIPESVTSIADNAFSGCDKLEIYCYEFSYAQSFAEEHGIKYVILDKYDLGDVDLSGRINIRDVSFIQLSILDKYNLPAFRYADVNRDGKVNIRDATTIQLYLVGKIKEF